MVRFRYGWLAGALVCGVLGCSSRSVVLRNATGEAPGSPWVWPYFLDGQPCVLAFWSTNEMQCLRDVPALKALDAREGSVQLITVACGRDRLEVDKWLRDQRIRYLVLLDLEGELANLNDVDSYPSYVLFDDQGKEVARTGDIRKVAGWFKGDRWQELALGKD
jgi:AhpC/TSA family